MGESSVEGRLVKTVEIYNPSTGTWS
ncbi:TPA: hypothetical protein QCR48_006139 [Bacillus cereus]|nr:hypothetical protein [Bacillus cereus]